MVDLSSSRWAPSSHRTIKSPLCSPVRGQPVNKVSSTTTINIENTTQARQQSITPRLTRQQRDLLTRQSDAFKFNKLSRRLKWKGQTLLYSYHRALNERNHNVVGGIAFPMDQGEAEMMFKIDFFEYYVLLERVLVHLLGVFGLIVSAAYGADGGSNDSSILNKDHNTSIDSKQEPSWITFQGQSEQATVPQSIATQTASNGPKSFREELIEQHQARAIFGDSTVFHGYAHRFHANVLSALDLPSNPLHKLLGTSPVRDYLGIAKEFRNRWKDAEEKPANDGDDGLVGSRYEKMLKDFKLDQMLGAILVAVESAKAIADEEMSRVVSLVGRSQELNEAMMDLDRRDVSARESNIPIEAMPDAMDWD